MTTNETDLAESGEETADGSPEPAEDITTPPEPAAEYSEPST